MRQLYMRNTAKKPPELQHLITLQIEFLVLQVIFWRRLPPLKRDKELIIY